MSVALTNLVKNIAKTNHGLSKEDKLKMKELLESEKVVYIEDLCKIAKPKTIFIMMANYNHSVLTDEAKAAARLRAEKFINHYHETVDSRAVFDYSHAIREEKDPSKIFESNLKIIPREGQDKQAISRLSFLSDLALIIYLDESIVLARSRDLPTGYRAQWRHGLTESQLKDQMEFKPSETKEEK